MDDRDRARRARTWCGSLVLLGALGCSDLPTEALPSSDSSSGGATSSGTQVQGSSTAVDPTLDGGSTTEPPLDETTTTGPATASTETGDDDSSSSDETGPPPNPACNDGVVNSGELCHSLGPEIALVPAPARVAIADLDLNGATDMVFTSTGSPDLQVLWGVGDGNVIAPQVLLTAGGPIDDIALEDFSNDGWPDLVLTDAANMELVAFANNQTGGLFFAGQYPAMLAPIRLTVGDFDGDGTPDLVAANASTQASLLRGNGIGGFILERTPVTLTNGVNWLGLYDLDLDMQLELVAVNQSGNDVSVYGNLGGMFDVAVDHPTSSTPVGIAAGDVDSNGSLDILVVHNSPPNVGLLRGDGMGALMAEELTSVAPNPIAAALADLDGNGALDLAVLHGNTDMLAIYRGQGDGTFLLGPEHMLHDPSAMRVGEFNGDGVPDIVVLRQADSLVQLLLSRP